MWLDWRINMREGVMPRYYTVKEVAQMLRRTTRTIYEWIRDGRLRAKRVRDGYLISEEAIDAVLVDYVPLGDGNLDEDQDGLSCGNAHRSRGFRGELRGA